MCVLLSVVVFCVFVTALCLKDMMREYVIRWRSMDIWTLRELLNKVTHKQKLNILQQTKIGRDRTALHAAAGRDDVVMITTILSSLQSSDRFKVLVMEDDANCTPLHRAASVDHTETVKAILNSLTADQQIQLLTVGDWRGKTAVEMASGETAYVLSEYRNRAREKADPGESIPLNFHVL